MNSLLITGGRVIDPASRFDALADVLIVEDKIAAIGPDPSSQAPVDAQKLDAGGRIVCPGLIDLHVHLREPGRRQRKRSRPARPPRREGDSRRSFVCPTQRRPLTTRGPWR